MEKNSKKTRKAMHEFKQDKLKSSKDGANGKIKSRKQAASFGLNETRKVGAKVPASAKTRR